jgi:uncharacterized protein (DUF885 family)
MVLKHSIEHTLKQIQESAQTVAQIKERTDQLLTKLGVTTAAEAQQLFDKEDNFTSDEWELLQELKQKWDEKIERQLSQVSNPNNRQKQMGERAKVQSHWVFVR